MALKLSPNSPCNRRTSLIRRISDLGLGIIPPLAKGRDDTRDYFRVSRNAPLRRGGENSGLRWRLSSASGGDLDRPQVAIWIGLGWRFASARAHRCDARGRRGRRGASVAATRRWSPRGSGDRPRDRGAGLAR